MKQILSLLFVYLLHAGVFALQTVDSDSFHVKLLRLEILVSDYNNSRESLFTLISQTNAIIETMEEGRMPSNNAGHIFLRLHVNAVGFASLENGFSGLGILKVRDLKTLNNRQAILKLRSELDFQRTRLAKFEDEYGKVESTLSVEDRQSLWQKIRSIEDEIFRVESTISDKVQEVRDNTIELNLTEEVFTPQSTTGNDIQFVNMPGAAYSYLHIENPRSELSAKSYHGYEVKYMFTKGKSYLNFGALKAGENSASNDQIQEMFIYSFGQDFYPRYLGRGQRNFLNLYTGYNIGGFFATTRKDNFHKFYAMANIGLELLKTNYILLDSRVCYFIPFYENRNLRGIIGNVSFNFVF